MLNDFLRLVLSITPWVTLLIAALLMLRKALGGKISARFFRLAWLILALRIVLPFDITLPQPPIEIALPVTRTQISTAAPVQYMFTLPSQESVPPLTAPAIATPEIAAAQSFDITHIIAILPYLWLAGAVIFLAVRFISYAVFMRRLAKTRKAFLTADRSVRIFTAPEIATPMLVGLLRPAIYLPENIAPFALPYVLAHEQCHRRSGDIPLQFLLLAATAVQWFNPLVHYMTHTAQRDIELACDEKVLRNKPIAYRKEYVAAVLDTLQKTRRRSVLATGFGGAPKTLKARFVQMFDMKAKKRGTALLCILLALLIATGTLVACTVQKPHSTAQTDPNVETANKILQTMFKNPDTETIKLLPAEMSAYTQHIKNKYAETCDDKLIERFLANGPAWQFDTDAEKYRYTTAAGEVSITKVSDGHYTFTVPITATYSIATFTSTIEAKGNLQFDENGKANYLQFSSLPVFAAWPGMESSPSFWEDKALVGDEVLHGMPYSIGIDFKNVTVCSYEDAAPKDTAANAAAKGMQGEQVQMLDDIVAKTADKAQVYIGYNVRALLQGQPEQIAQDYAQLLTALQEKNPQVSYTIMEVLPVTQQAAEKNKVFAPEQVKALNEALRKTATEKNASFLEIPPSFLDENGNLSPDIAEQDGMHLTPKGYLYWENWIRTGQDLTQQAQNTAQTNEWTWPVPQYTHISREMTGGHRGIDLAAPKGTKIYAAAVGTVIELSDGNVAASAPTTDPKSSYGKYIVIDHGNKISTLYAQCDSINVKIGQMVEAGQEIATVGSSGNSTGNHLHFEMEQIGDGVLLNPMKYFDIKGVKQ